MDTNNLTSIQDQPLKAWARPELPPVGEKTAIPPRPPRNALQKDLPPLPRKRMKLSGMLLSFLIFVGLPVAVATIYYSFIATNQYVTEFRFSVLQAPVTTSYSSNPGSGGQTSTSSSGSSSGTPSFSPENFVVIDYLSSQQAIEDLEARMNLRDMYSRDSYDWWARFNPARSKEMFVRYWQRHVVNAQFDPLTGLATVEVHAFSPTDAKKVADGLVTLSEELINRIAMRTSLDAVKFAEGEVKRSEDRLKAIRLKLSEYRNREGVIDPTASVVASNAALAQSLRQTLTNYETSMASLLKQNVGANSPVIQNLKSQIKATRDQIRIVETQVGQSTDGTALSKVMGEYEQLDLERQFAQNMVTSAMQALDQARANAASQPFYITPYVRPFLPEQSMYPRRIISVLLVALCAFVIWTVLLLLFRSVREHMLPDASEKKDALLKAKAKGRRIVARSA